MSFNSDFEAEMVRINRDQQAILSAAALELYNAVVVASPVDSGELKQSWQTPDKESENVYVVKNIAPHAIVIDDGRRTDPDGVTRGSEQLFYGYTPIVKQVETDIQRMLR